MSEIALVTYAGLPDLDPDDRSLVPALAARGVRAAPVVWDDPDFDWSRPRMAFVRNPWDYYRRYDEFLAWARATSAATLLVNPLRVLEWNLDKRYLVALAEAGLPVVPTLHLERGAEANLAARLAERGWERAVVKPAVSADSWETIVLAPGEVARGEEHLDRLLPERAMLVQPFLESVETSGERCLVFIDGEFSHAVRKNALTQGGRWAGLPEGTAAEAAPDELEVARRVLATACRLGGFEPPMYARVDLARDLVGGREGQEGRPLLLELELSEPTLFLTTHAAGLERLADAIVRRLARSATY
ncbi:MAG: hypothetical protein KDB94_05665 [Acidobacteria bacterium]|nr:hypothetical protein [Acidobacteriota bacterium]MCB9378722.1 hypothetical protein [Holophagales bacterium]